MANIKSQKKRILTNERDRKRNQAFKTRMKSLIKATKTAIEEKTENSETMLKNTLKIIDKTVSKGVIHKRTAARRKSALALAFNKTK